MKTPNPSVDPGAAPALLDRAVALWRKAQVLHEVPSWKGQPEARALAERIAASHAASESALAALLLDSNQLVVAYALLTLELMRSPVLRDLPSELLQRRSNITIVSGSVKTGMDLGGLARQIQKRARARADVQPTPLVSAGQDRT
jgi:hypothetical protein